MTRPTLRWMARRADTTCVGYPAPIAAEDLSSDRRRAPALHPSGHKRREASCDQGATPHSSPRSCPVEIGIRCTLGNPGCSFRDHAQQILRATYPSWPWRVDDGDSLRFAAANSRHAASPRRLGWWQGGGRDWQLAICASSQPAFRCSPLPRVACDHAPGCAAGFSPPPPLPCIGCGVACLLPRDLRQREPPVCRGSTARIRSSTRAATRPAQDACCTASLCAS